MRGFQWIEKQNLMELTFFWSKVSGRGRRLVPDQKGSPDVVS
jgi:hypothetical protein